MSKPKVGFYWCASCGGCEESVVDLAEDILGVVDAVDFVFFPVAMDFKRSDVEAMADGEMAVCMINGAVRTSEQLEMVELLRKKSGLIIAYGSCSAMGGIPGLANLYTKAAILKAAYGNDLSTDNPDFTLPSKESKVPEGELELPVLHDTVKALDQVIDVDFYIPGCAPPVKLLKNALGAILSGNLPPKGTVLAPDIAVCDECPRNKTKPEKMLIEEYKRPHEDHIDPEQCLLVQGFLCLGPVTRQGCDAACPQANMPCTGCQGPLGTIVDYGAKALSGVASLLDSNDGAEIEKLMAEIADPVGTFYRYSLPSSQLFRAVNLEEEKS
jgi:F420-non-reducing hydrogenase small subunit